MKQTSAVNPGTGYISYIDDETHTGHILVFGNGRLITELKTDDPATYIHFVEYIKKLKSSEPWPGL